MLSTATSPQNIEFAVLIRSPTPCRRFTHLPSQSSDADGCDEAVSPSWSRDTVLLTVPTDVYVVQVHVRVEL